MTSASPVVLLDAAAVHARCSPAEAVDAIVAAVRAGLDPAADVPRSAVDVQHGQLLVMPSAATDGLAVEGLHHVGIKVVTVAPGNPAAGLPRIQGTYLLFDRSTLALAAVLDGAALTALRTPAVSVAAINPALRARPGPLTVAVVGAGPQAVGHVEALRSFLGEAGLGDVRHLVRDPASARTLLGAGAGIVRLGTDAAEAALSHADVVVCATSARTPLFDSRVLGDRAIVVAVGSHEPDAREVDASLCARAAVVVEDVGTALREAGDVVLAIEEGAIVAEDLVPLQAVLDGSARLPDDRPVLFKSVGMAWEDLVVASAIVRRMRLEPTQDGS